MLVQIKTTEEFRKVISTGKVLVDFYADWCTPCKMQAPALEELSEEGFTVAKVNVDEQEELAMQYQIRSIPALFLFVDGEVKEKISGLTGKEELAALFAKA